MVFSYYMTKILSLAASILFLSTQAFSTDIPYSTELNKRLRTIEAAVGSTSASTDGAGTKRVARVTWNPSASSDQGSSTTNSGVHALGVSLPAGAIVTDTYGYVKTAVTTGTTGISYTTALKCEDAANLLAATNLETAYADNSIILGKQQGTSTVNANRTAIAASCEISAVVSGKSATAGKIVFFIEYVVGVP